MCLLYLLDMMIGNSRRALIERKFQHYQIASLSRHRVILDLRIYPLSYNLTRPAFIPICYLSHQIFPLKWTSDAA